MSRWVHITSCMSVDTCIEDDNLVNKVKELIEKAPKITGSEENASVYVNLQNGYNAWTVDNCEDCPQACIENDIIECDAPTDFKCPAHEFQTCVVISIQGDLRDRLPSQTQKEFSKFFKFIEKHYIIRDYSLNIQGE